MLTNCLSSYLICRGDPSSRVSIEQEKINNTAKRYIYIYVFGENNSRGINALLVLCTRYVVFKIQKVEIRTKLTIPV